MKCQHCEKIATFHVTELTDPEGPTVIHLCEDHAKEFFKSEDAAPETKALSELLTKQLQLEQAAKEIAAIDKKKCPVCGITFSEFRKGGRLGCPYDYVVFEEDLVPLLMNIHGAQEHVGKEPKHVWGSPERQLRLKRLRQKMDREVAKEDYEKAARLRDRIAAIEAGEVGGLPSDDEDLLEGLDDSYQAAPKKKGSLGAGEDVDEDEFDEEADFDEEMDEAQIEDGELDGDEDDLDDDDLDDDDLDDDDLDDDDLDDDDLDDDDLDEDDLDEDDLEDDDLDDEDLDDEELDDDLSELDDDEMDRMDHEGMDEDGGDEGGDDGGDEDPGEGGAGGDPRGRRR
jgi:protein arginine kinase activator